MRSTLRFRSNSSGSSVNSPSALGPSSAASASGGGGGGLGNGLGSSTGGSGMATTNPYGMSSLYHSPGVQGYCTPGDQSSLSLANHYTEMRNTANWYGTTANDPRFASE